MRLALVDRLRALPAEERRKILANCAPRELAALRWCWRDFWARPDNRDPFEPTRGRGQIAPAGEWTWWVNVGGRGSGKTETCARWVTEKAMEQGKGAVFILLAPSLDGPNGARIVMIEGRSGLAQAAPPWAGFDYKSSIGGGLVTWRSGAVAHVFGADKPATGRGPQCCGMWLDDPAAYGKHGFEMFKQLLHGFRNPWPDGSECQGVLSSTPMDSELMDFFLDALEDKTKRKSRIVFSESITDDNRANLTRNFFDETLAEFAGTELEAQERFGQRLKSRSGKVFNGVAFDVPPVRVGSLPPDIVAIAVWIDPATSSESYSCEVGIVVVALDARGHVYGLEDRSKVMSANEWPDVALDAAEHWSDVAPTHLGIEVNKGGQMGPALLQQAERIRRMNRGLPGVAMFECRIAKATGSKAQRGAPAAKLAKTGRLHLLPGLEKLEAQLRELDDNDAPRAKRDRADAFVHGVVDLALGAYVVGGDKMPMGPLGPPPLGSINVGVQETVSAGQAIAAMQSGQMPTPFAFGVPAGWR